MVTIQIVLDGDKMQYSVPSDALLALRLLSKVQSEILDSLAKQQTKPRIALPNGPLPVENNGRSGN